MFVPPGPVLRCRDLVRGGRGRWREWMPPGRLLQLRSGRQAISLVLRELAGRGPRRALLPAFVCPSVVTPFRECGFEPLFYPVNADAVVEAGPLAPMLRHLGASVLLLVHYFGFPQPRLAEIRDLCREHRVALIEDCAHALFSRSAATPLGSHGDAAIFSLRKSLAVPEGGMCVLRGSFATAAAPARSARPEVRGLLRECAYGIEHAIGVPLRARLLVRQELRAAYGQRDEARSTGDLAALGPVSAAILDGTEPSRVVAARRRNFLFWQARARELPPGWRPLHQNLPDGACPLGYPVLVPRRDAVRVRLCRRGVAPRVLWEALPPEADARSYPHARALSEQILLLPVHQTLDEAQLERTFDAVVRT